MKHVTEATKIIYKMFEPGELVYTQSSRSTLKRDTIYRVERCVAPNIPYELDSTIFVEGEPYGVDTEYVEVITVRELWDAFSDIPVNDDGEIEKPFYYYDIGTHREAVWWWFEERLGASVADLMGV